MHNPKNLVRIGISGWTFPPWRGLFYPKTVKQKDELAFASRALTAIEVNGTFYSLQKPHTFQKWHDETPEGFLFTVKAPKYITHERRLKDVEHAVANFFASGLLLLGEKLGSILWQFPPTLPFLPERFEPFLAALPHTLKEAAVYSKNHSDWMKERAVTEAPIDGRLRHAIEVRHESFKCNEFVELLRKYNVAIVVGDTAGRWPLIEDVTSDFVYIRLHGDEIIYPKGYTKQAIAKWEDKIRAWSNGEEPTDAETIAKAAAAKERLVFAFFDNDEKTTAPINALEMQALFTNAQSDPIETHAKTSVAEKKPRKAAKKTKVA